MAEKNENVSPTLVENPDSEETEMETVQDKELDVPKQSGDFQEPDSNGSTEFKTPNIQFKMPEKLPLTSPITNLENAKPKQVKKPENDTKNQTTEKSNQAKQKPKPSNLSPAEQLKQSQVTFPYKEPSWSGLPDPGYSFEVLKNGSIIENIELKDKPFYVFGRLPSCDVTMEHPSLSRYHAVIQFCKNPSDSVSESGWYLFDLDSTHGTWLNKNKVKPEIYHRIHVGHVVKFGGSTRLHILQGPETDQEEESELSITEMKNQRDRQKWEAEFLRLADQSEAEKMRQHVSEDQGCSWGMGEEAEEEPEEMNFITPQPENEDLYIDDPKKALKGFYEREGCDLPEYIITDEGPAKYKCRLDLPVDGVNGEPLIAEVVISGKKKEAVVACALEACRLLDKHQLLRQAKHESRKRKAKNWEADDFYDSDEDEFLDRTGTIQIKRNKRMIQAGKIENKTDNYDSLLEKHTATVKEMEEIEARLEQAKAEAALYSSDDVDELDAYMSAIKAGVMDTKTKMQLKRQLIILRTEEMRLRRLVNIAKPASLPELKQPVKTEKPSNLPVGKIGSLNSQKTVKKPVPATVSPLATRDEDVEEEEEDEEEEDANTNVKSSSEDTNMDSDSKTSVDNLQAPANKQSESKPRSNVTALSSVLEQLQGAVPDDKKSKSSSGKIKGPALPPSLSEENPRVSDESERKREKQLSGVESSDQDLKKKTRKELSEDDEANDPDYAAWLPPSGQTGDGKTHLNDKYGY